MGDPVFANGMEIASKSSDCKVIAGFPDVCLSPPPPPAGPIPLPYPISSFASDTADGSSTVMIGDQPVMLKDQSNYSKCTGDEAATKAQGMGVMTGCITGKVYYAMWSPDVKFEGENVDRHLDITNGNGQSNTNQFAMPTVGQMSPPATPPTPNCNPSKVELKIQRSLLTLKHARECFMYIEIEPADIVVDKYRIEIQRDSGGGWCPITTKQMVYWRAVIAGKFMVRGVATICGAEHKTPEESIEVQFPNYDQIVGDPDVRKGLNAAWADSLNDCTDTPINQAREIGFWINLNTRDNRYEMGSRTYGNWSYPHPNYNGASVTIGARPADNPSAPGACDSGAVYPVASFHTHPPMTFWPPGWTRPVGPSAGDLSADSGDNVPGVVYDYVATTLAGEVEARHPKSAAAQLYHSRGLDRRPTP